MLIIALVPQAQYFVPNRSPIALIDGFDEGVISETASADFPVFILTD